MKEWYRSDEISFVVPGMKDFISVKIEYRRMQVQKRPIPRVPNEFWGHSVL